MKNKENTVLIAGGSGLVGKRLTALLLEKGYYINILSRSSQKSNDPHITYYKWNIDRQEIDIASLAADFIINLAGAGIADKRWTSARKTEILESRTKSSALIAGTLLQNKISVKHYIGASAIGIYGSSEEPLLTETQISSENAFMVDVCRQWEEAHQKTKPSTDKFSILRIGIVLSTKGGALKEILKPLLIGRLGTYFGNGDMVYSWIHIDDLCQMCIDLINNDLPNGLYNAVSPNPSTNKQLVESIIETKNLTAIKMAAPSFIMKIILGEMSNTILNSTSVSAAKLQAAGFTFSYPNLNMALIDIFSDNK